MGYRLRREQEEAEYEKRAMSRQIQLRKLRRAVAEKYPEVMEYLDFLDNLKARNEI